MRLKIFHPLASNSPDMKRAGTTLGCIPDANAQLRNVSCAVGWLEQAVAQHPRTRPVLHIQVGTAMGYSLATFLSLWNDPSLTPQKWHKKLKQYGNRNAGRLVRHVRSASCGECGECRAKQMRVHTRKGGRSESGRAQPRAAPATRGTSGGGEQMAANKGEETAPG